MRQGTPRSKLAVLAAIVLAGMPQTAQATHLAGGHITWKPAGVDLFGRHTIVFAIQLALRRDALSPANPAVGTTLTAAANPNLLPAFYTGDPSFSVPNFLDYTVTSVDAPHNLMVVQAEMSYTYPASTTGSVTAYVLGADRVASQNANSQFQVDTLVNLGSDTTSPLPGAPAIVRCLPSTTCSFAIPVFDPAGDFVQFRLAQPSESQIAAQPGPPQAPYAAAVSPQGQYTWNTTNASAVPVPSGVPVVGTYPLYATQVVLTGFDGNGVIRSTAAEDFLLELINYATAVTIPHPTFTQPDPACGSMLTVTPGSPIAFNVQAAAAQSPFSYVQFSTVMNVTGMPLGAALFIGAPASAVTGAFSWTPTLDRLGSYVVTFDASHEFTDQTGFYTGQFGMQAICPIAIQVTTLDVGVTDSGNGTFTALDTPTFNVVVTNKAAAPTSAPIKLHLVPFGPLNATAITPGAGWTCSSVLDLTCTYTGTVAPGASTSAVTLTVFVSDPNGNPAGLRAVTWFPYSPDRASNVHAVNILPLAPTTTPSVAAATYSPNAQNVSLSATVTRGGFPLNGGTVTFVITRNGSQVGTSTTSGQLNSSGYATVQYSLPGGTSAGAYTISATYNPPPGSPISSSSGSASLVVGQAMTSITINNLPASAVYGGSFTPSFAYVGDGATSVTTGTPATCAVSGGVVSFAGAGSCTLIAHAGAGVNYQTVDGSPQQFNIDRATTTISITNLPANAIAGANFSPAFAYVGDGATSVTSGTTSTCTVAGNIVNFVGVGTCTLTAHAALGTNYKAVDGSPQQFTIHYNFGGFFSPVSATAVNVTKAGSAVPINFSLGGAFGLAVLAANSPVFQQTNCTTQAQILVDSTVTAGGSSLQFDPATNQYTYIWKTDKAWAGSCGVFVLGLNDGNSYRLNFQFF